MSRSVIYVRCYKLWEASNTLPYVRSVVADILYQQHEIGELRCKIKARRKLWDQTWSQRCHLYQFEEDCANAEQALIEALEELATLDIFLLDEKKGLIGFPTCINQYAAYYLWEPVNSDGIHFWRFFHNPQHYSIPSNWHLTPSFD